MLFPRLIFVLGVCLISHAAQAYQADRILRILPVVSLQETATGVVVQYVAGCNSSFAGLMIKSHGQGVLRAGVLSQQDAIICAEVPAYKSVTIAGMRLGDFRVILPLDAKSPNSRLYNIPAQDVAQLNIERLLQTTHESRCGDILGHAFSTVPGSNLVQVSVVEELATVAPCDSKLVLSSVDQIDLTNARVHLAAALTKVDPKRVFALRLAPVQAGSIKKLSKSRGVALTYRRRCNEAPVGVVVNYKRGETIDGGTTQIGMMVARYPNQACAAGAPEYQLAEARDTNTDLAVGSKVARLMPSSSDGLVGASAQLKLLAPVRYVYGNRDTGEGLALDYLAACKAPVGVVYARDASGELSLGIVVREHAASANNRACKNQIKEVSLLQPHFVRARAGQNIFGLRVQGFSL